MTSQRDIHIKQLVERGMQQKQTQCKATPTAGRGAAQTTVPRSGSRSTAAAPAPRRSSSRVEATSSQTAQVRPVQGSASRAVAPKRPSANPLTEARGQGVSSSSTRNAKIEAAKREKANRQAQKIAERDAKNAKKSALNSQDYPDRNIWMSLGLLFIGGFLTICCVSYLVHWDVDQDIASWDKLVGGAKAVSAMNWGGKFGAIVSRNIMGDWFGLFGMMLPVAVFCLAIQVLRIPSIPLRRGALSSVVIMVLGSVVMGHFFGVNTQRLGSGYGGEMGIYMAQWLQDMIGYQGTTLLVVLLAFATLYFTSSAWVRSIAKDIIRAYRNHKTNLNLKRELAEIKYQEALAENAARKAEHQAKADAASEQASLLRKRLNGDRYDNVDVTQVPIPQTTTTKEVDDVAFKNEGTNSEGDKVGQDKDGDDESRSEDESRSVDSALPNSREDMVSSPHNYDDKRLSGAIEYDAHSKERGLNQDTEWRGSLSEEWAEFDSSPATQPMQNFILQPSPTGSNGYLAGYDACGAPVVYYWLGSDQADTILWGVSPNLTAEQTQIDEEFTITSRPEATINTMEYNGLESGFGTYSDNSVQTYETPYNGQPSALTGAKSAPSMPLSDWEREQLEASNSNEDFYQDDFPIRDSTPYSSTDEVISHPNGEIIARFAPSKEDPNFIVEQKISEQEVDDHVINLTELYDPTLELASYQKPPIELMANHSRNVSVSEEELVENKNRIVTTLENFGIKIDTIEATIGPTVTLYEIIPAPGVRISKIKNLEDDIALALSALGIRIIAPIPGKGTIGIEVPNKDKEVVSMYSVIKSAKFQDSTFELPIALGKTIQNETFVMDLTKMPHLLVAGATGQGKSVGLNAIITSLLYKKHPSELKFILVDPKKVELTLYSRLEKHFLAKLPDAEEAIITDTQKVIYTLNSLCIEMDSRYDLLKAAKVRNIKEYNDKFINRRLNPNKGHRYLPYFVVIVDEFADLIMTAGREVETPIARIAQLARAVGIHLIIATQRPTTNIITGVIKANFPARIAFRVSSMIDSRTILDSPGANQLVGKGDMLVSTGSEVTRVQCAFIDTPEVEAIAEHIGAQRGYPTAYELPEYVPEGDASTTSSDEIGKLDSLFHEVARYVVANDNGSASTIQRKFSIGFNRAGRIVDQLEAAGIVGRSEGSKPRQVLIQDPMSLEMILDNYGR